MSQAAALNELARQVRGDTLRLLAAAPEAWVRWAPQGTSNHVLWHAGHAVWLQDVLFVELVTGTSELPDGWEEMFGMDCRPVKESDALRAWPSRVAVEQLLKEQLERVMTLLSAIPEETLAGDASPVHGSRNLLSCVVHAWHDEAKHQGEMYLLLKLRKALAIG